MDQFLHWFISPVSNAYVLSGLSAIVNLMRSSSFVFWILLVLFARYQVPDMLLWIAYVVRPKAFEPPPLRKYATAKPLVSFIIAGRNPGDSIVSCIESVLHCDYKNVEIIFADDCSTDNTVELARPYERTGKVRVLANPNHSGKPANLNLALMAARGEFIFVLDADTQIFPDTVDLMLPYFEDPRVGGVSPCILVRNAGATWLTRFQEIEYVLTYTLAQLWRDKIDMILIQSGMGTMFRTAAMKSLGGYDMGLGDDTDITTRLRKTHWKLHTALRAKISTDVPENLRRLVRQRIRWVRNMVKTRLRKHKDLGNPFRYGWINAIAFWELVVNRAIRPILVVAIAIYAHYTHGTETPFILGGLYWFATFFLAIKFFIAHDMTQGYPTWRAFWLVPFFILYRIPLLFVQITQVVREGLQINTWHPYVPRRIWNQIPHH